MKLIYTLACCLLFMSCITNGINNDKTYIKAIGNIHLGTDKTTFEEEKMLFLQNYSTLSNLKVNNIEALYHNDKVVRIFVFSESQTLFEQEKKWSDLYQSKYSNFIKDKQYIIINNDSVEILVSDECKTNYLPNRTLVLTSLDCWNTDSIKNIYLSKLKETTKAREPKKTAKKKKQEQWEKAYERFLKDANSFHSTPSIISRIAFSDKYSVIDIKDKKFYNQYLKELNDSLKSVEEKERKKSFEAI